jgi:hypothetical protein
VSVQARTAVVDLAPLRAAGAAVLGAAAIWPLVPVHPPLACPLRTTTGIPCPLCGMTRAVTAAVHGDLAASLRYNPAGVVVVLLAVALLLTWRVRGVRAPRVSLPAVVVPLVVLWGWNLAFNPTF